MKDKFFRYKLGFVIAAAGVLLCFREIVRDDTSMEVALAWFALSIVGRLIMRSEEKHTK